MDASSSTTIHNSTILNMIGGIMIMELHEIHEI